MSKPFHVQDGPIAKLTIRNGTRSVYAGEFVNQKFDEVVLPPSVLKLLECAFKGWKSMREIVFEEGSTLQKIGLDAFRESGLTRITLPPSLDTVSQGAFYNCRHLRRVQFGDGLEALGTNEYRDDGGVLYGVFENSAVEEITLPLTLKRIEYRAFWGCENFIAISLPEGLEAIGDNCFQKSGIREFFAPDSLRTIGKMAFADCQNLRNVRLNSVVQMAEDVFCNTKIETVTTPLRSDVSLRKTFGKDVRVTVEIPAGTKIVEKLKGMDLNVERVIIPTSVTEIQNNAFNGMKSLKEVVFADGSRLEKIGIGAFSCTGLERFMAPPSLRVLAQAAFYQCRELRSVELNEGLEALGTDEYFIDGGCCGVFESTAVENVKLPSTLRQIECNAFRKCKNLKHIKLPSCLETIGNQCFQASSLEEVEVPKYLTEIPPFAFYGCTDLKSVTFAKDSWLEKVCHEAFVYTGIDSFAAPEQLKEIEAIAFYECESLNQVQLGEEFKEAGELCFANTPLKKLELPKHVAKTNSELGIGCSYENITLLPEGLQVVGKDQEGIKNAEVVIVPSCVKEFAEGAFRDCKDLRKLIFQEGSQLVAIGKDCFAGSGLEEFVAPSSLRTIAQEAFADCERLRRVVLNEGLEVLGTDIYPDGGGLFRGVFQDSALESVELSLTLRKIEYRAFRGCKCLKHIELPEGLEQVGEQCFFGSGLEEVTLPLSLVDVGHQAFDKCEDIHVYVPEGYKARNMNHSIQLMLQGPRDVKLGCETLLDFRKLWVVELPDGLERVGDWWFAGSNMKRVGVPASVQEIGSYAFRDCRMLKEVSFADGSCLEAIRSFAFQLCKSLKKVDFPASLRYVNRGCFQESGIEYFAAPQSLFELGDAAFQGCKALQSVTLNVGTIGLGARCFYQSGIKETKVSHTLRAIGEEAFCECKRLRAAMLNEGLRALGPRAFAESAVRDVGLPSTLKRLEPRTFWMCQDLKNVEFQEGLDRIGKACFAGSALSEVIIPRSVRVVDEEAFMQCARLQACTLAKGSILRKVGSGAFAGTLVMRGSVQFPSRAEVADDAF